MAAEVERNLLNHYGLTNLYPAEWPEREDESDASEDEDKLERNLSRNSRMSKSRFAGLDKQMSIRSRLSGTRESGGGPGNLVQKDEADPLGVAPSVVQELRRRGLAVEDDLKLRNRFMLSSTTFSPTLFLSQVHQTASTDSLLQGLDFLSRSIEKKSASLKVLVESNFERFVRAKATIDNVYMEMRTQGVQQQAAAPPPRKPHSRHTSKGSTHFRNTSGPFSPIASKAPVEDKKKNALTKESEYGVQGIKAPLIELAVKAEEVWGPALGGRDREDELKSVLTYVEQNKSTLQLGGGIRDSIRKRDYETLVQDYNHASRLSEQARSIAEDTIHQDRDLTDGQIHQIIVTAKMWHDVQTQLDAFKVDAMRQLASAQSDSPLAGQEEKRETHMEVIAVLLQIGIDENPFWFWLSSWYDRLKNKILRTFERARLEIEVLRRRLANSDKPAMAVVKAHLQSAAVGAGKDRGQHLDSAKVIQFWELVESALRNLLSARGGLLGEIVEFWDTARSLIESKAQKRLPAAVWNTEASKRHLEMSQEHVEQLYNGVAELIQLTRESVFALFTDPPIEDISDLFSPLPQTPGTPQSAFPANDRPARFNFDPADLPLPSPQKGEAWEKYAFWPPNANALSGVHYLSRILILVGTAASEATAISAIKQDTRMTEQLRGLVGGVRERCVQAVCAAWNSDAEKCKVLEDWTRSADRRDLTNMPASFMAFEETILTNMQKILYISEAMTRTDSADVVVPPSAKLLQMVRSQFVTSLYKALSGTVENAERTNTGDVANDDDLDLRAGFYNINASANAVEGTDRNVRMLLTLSNLNHLRREIIPQLISQFETSFSVKLTEESKTIRDVLGQIDARLFQSYVRPTVDRLSSIITLGVTPPSWLPQTKRPTNAKPYVYDVLLSLVLVHTEVSTSATALTNQILSYLLEQVSTSLLAAFKQRSDYTLPALMQATLDVELIAQTLSNYTTEKASDVQSQIYLVLDERTDHDARSRLQGELPEMRATLKKLREGTKGQFGCFRRDRRGRSERPVERPSSRQ